jgi:hypothetical protein
MEMKLQNPLEDMLQIHINDHNFPSMSTESREGVGERKRVRVRDSERE